MPEAADWESDSKAVGSVVTLYHGTSARFRKRIERNGIGRFSWFSTDMEDAKDFGELAVREKGEVDIWKVEVPSRELDSISWQLGGKRGTFYKLHHKAKEEPMRIETYHWDLKTMGQRPGKIL